MKNLTILELIDRNHENSSCYNFDKRAHWIPWCTDTKG